MRTVELLHLALLEAESHFAFSRETLGRKYNTSSGKYELFERGVEEDKINNRGRKPYRLVILPKLDLLNT